MEQPSDSRRIISMNFVAKQKRKSKSFKQVKFNELTGP